MAEILSQFANIHKLKTNQTTQFLYQLAETNLTIYVLFRLEIVDF